MPKLDAIEVSNEISLIEGSQIETSQSQLVNGICKSEKSDEDFINITNGGDRMEEGKSIA